jgi:hypothetical protein
LHIDGFFIFRALGWVAAGLFLLALSNKRKLGNLRGNYPTSALRQSSRASRKILSVDQGNVHCFAGRLKDRRNRFGFGRLRLSLLLPKALEISGFKNCRGAGWRPGSGFCDYLG